MKNKSLFVFTLLTGGLAMTVAEAQTTTSYEDLPSYNYDSSMDPVQHPYKTPKAHDGTTSGSGITMGTMTGVDVAVKFSDYNYQANSSNSGAVIGVSVDAADTHKSGWFLSGGIRADYGLSQDSGAGKWLFDGQIMVGHDFLQEWSRGNYGISPDIGIGYRYLYGDSRDFFYLPIGITQNIRLTRDSRLSINTELDPALGTTSDALGFRSNIMYQWASWSVGPFLEYWSLSDASSDDTIEFGLQARYRF